MGSIINPNSQPAKAEIKIASPLSDLHLVSLVAAGIFAQWQSSVVLTIYAEHAVDAAIDIVARAQLKLKAGKLAERILELERAHQPIEEPTAELVVSGE